MKRTRKEHAVEEVAVQEPAAAHKGLALAVAEASATLPLFSVSAPMARSAALRK